MSTMRSSFTTVATGNGKLNRSLFNTDPYGNRKRKPSVKGQIVMNPLSHKGFDSDCIIKLIHSENGGRSYVGMYGDKKVKRVGVVNGTLTPNGATAGRWVYA